MILLDTQTIIFSHVLTDIVCTAVILSLWRQSRLRFAGTGLLAFDFAFQLAAMGLIALRGGVPDWMSMTLSDTLVVGGAILGYMGLGLFTGKKIAQIHNYILLAAFACVQTYFTVIQPHPSARTLSLSAAMLIVFFQCMWLLVYRVESGMRRLTLFAGMVFGAFCLVSIVEIVRFLAGAPLPNHFFRPDPFEPSILISYQMLLILLNFSLVLMINKRLFMEIRAQEEKFGKAFHSSPYAVTLTRLSDGRIIEVNDGFSKITGYGSAEAVGKTTADLHLWGNEEDRTAVVNELSRSGEVQGREFRFRKKSEETIAGFFSAQVIMVDNDRFVLSSINDITERKRAEEELRRSREWLAVTLRSIGDAVIAADARGLVTFLNPVCSELTGWTPQEALGKPIQSIFRIVNEKTREPGENIAARVLRDGHAVNLANNTALIARDGRETPIEDSAAPIKDREGNVLGVVLVFRDVAEKRRTQEALKESEKHYRSLFGNMLNGFAYCKMLYEGDVPKDFVFLNVNRAFETLTGLKNVIAKKASEVIPGIRESDPGLFDIYGRVIGSGVPERFETYVKALGQWLSISVYSPEKEHFVTVFDVITERKLAEAELVRAKIEWERTFDSVPDLIAILDSGHRIVRVNLEMARRLGMKPEECVGMHCFEVVHGMGQPPTFCPHCSGLSDSYGQVTEVHEERLGGDFLVSMTPLLDENGQLMGAVHVARDITRRRVMEEDLRRSRDELELRVEERTKELLEANRVLWEKAEIIDLAHDAVIVRDSESRIVFWNKGAQETYGFTGEEALGRVSNDLLQTQFSEPVSSVIETVLKTGEWTGELRHTRADGEWIFVESRWAVNSGNAGGFLEVNRDITARKIAQEQFRRADRAFRTLSECNQAMVRQPEERELLQEVCRIVVDVGGYRMAWVGFAENDENKTVLPVASAGHDQGYLNRAGITWADNPRGEGPTGTAVRTGKMIISQNALLNPAYQPWRTEGNRRGYASSIALPLIVEKRVIGALTIYASEPDAFDEGEAGLLSNLAENLAYGIASIRVAEQRKRSEEELRVYASRLEIINKELQDFAFAASHDLQEPLRKIQTFCDMTMKRCALGLDNTGQEYLGRVLNSAGRMRQLLRDLLEFSRVAARPESFERIELVEIVREAADVFEASVREKACRIEIENLPAIDADEGQMLRLFQNLIGNALKFRSGEDPHIRICGKSDGQGVCEISVKDNGIGFDQQFAELIFKPFQKLHGRSEYDGTGMGLAICRKIVERHGGTIRAESEPGKGSTFIIRLPFKQAGPETFNPLYNAQPDLNQRA